ncbi:type II toxin-antitoxin system RelB family antitoxin [Parasphaerochaeta coccoides]|uniref:CopG family transcriptional regulator n=1 Tax=Parasphaerochaeta coccoides (strain ATCC BAA-1237 / DSM 17374 / SPN1) TaxID=760011 RepID=F4GKM0_PARC1|nr:DUF6290 family protein [Parasphaerochaeta coccoides]AEC01429.1 CopG family transcriptional regulator [Parasphaerochaeta coccoides DSM 17374]
MPHITFRVSDQEKSWIDSYAQVNGVSISDAVKTVFFEKLEHEYDLKIIQEFEAEKKSGSLKVYSHNEVGKMLELK